MIERNKKNNNNSVVYEGKKKRVVKKILNVRRIIEEASTSCRKCVKKRPGSRTHVLRACDVCKL